MKKTVLHLILFCFLLSPILAQTEADPSEVLKSNFIKENPEITLGYKPAPFKINSMKRPAWDARYKSSSALPTTFDLRTLGRVTPAKNQGGGVYGGNCTMFSSIGALESRWLTMGLGEFDLAEQHMAACIGFNEENWGYGQGGNQFTCSAYLTRFKGPVLESQNPYNEEVHPCLPFLNPIAMVPEARWLPAQDFDLLRRTIYYYGAVYAGIYWDITGDSFNDTDDTYYYGGALPANHAVLVCGWDDSKVTAGGTGAWIVKNSWGTEWADSGFFYISYQDTRFAADEIAYYPTRWNLEDVDITYIHDEVGFTATLPIGINKVYEMAKFIAGEAQLVTHVGVAVPDPETVLDFHIFEDFTDEPSNLIGKREDIYVEIPGIYTFELPVPVNGDFFIQVTREVGGNEVNHAVEAFDEGFSDPIIEPDVNWVRREGADAWLNTNSTDMGLDFNLTIRAYARSSSAPAALFSADNMEACLGSELTYTYLENNAADSWTWDFGKDASPATANTKGPHNVTYSTEGTKTVSLIVSGAGGSDTVVRYDYIDIVPSIRVNILQEDLAFPQGQSRELTAYGANSYQWSPASLVDNASAQSVLATPPAEGTHTLIVTGTQGTCTGTDTIELSTTNKPAHDDMCDAMLIHPGGWIGWWTNEFATLEEGEPAPEDTDCYAPMKWCVDSWNDNTIQNSLWYYFYGPDNGIASIRLSGIDSQIAVYRADTCTEIDSASLVAANDDPSTSELAARLDAVNVEPGKKYFLQVDGSLGGAVGVFELWFYEYPTGVDDQKIIQAFPSLSIFPNPGKDIFNIHLENAGSSRVEIFVYNLNGQILKQKSFEGISGRLDTRFDLSQYPGGIYHIQILDGDQIINGKLVKR